MSGECSPLSPAPGTVASEQPALNARRALLLATIVYEYVETAEPVGSALIAQKYQLGVSSATIRNEMAELEAQGYLVQPHTSAGRIPSDTGYRLFVDRLMTPENLPGPELGRIRDELRAASRELDDVIQTAARVLGRYSRNFAFAVAPTRAAAVFRHLQLIWFSSRSGLAVVVTTRGVASQLPFDLSSDVEADALTMLSNRLNVALGGSRLSGISADAIARVVEACDMPRDLIDVVRRALRVAGGDEHAVTSSGAQHLLDQPEFHDLKKLRAVLKIVEEQKALYDLVADSLAGDAPAVKIGHELGEGEMSEFSVLAVPYRTRDEGVGMLALLGPRRMPYGRLLALLAGTASSLTHRLADDGT